MPFKSARAFGSWLKKNHTSSPGIWIQFFKKGSGVKTIVYVEALDEALCHGWIDSQVKSLDEKSYMQVLVRANQKASGQKEIANISRGSPKKGACRLLD